VLFLKKFIAKVVKKSGFKNAVQPSFLDMINFVNMISKIFIFALTLSLSNAGWGSSNDPGKVLLRDVQVLTLKSGQMTTGRRSSPVPQLKCVGGSAQGHFNPQAVQCYNRGFDGQDVQWECKADMDNLYRFGSVEVICEGYDYPDDPYILKGSCGLEYTLELTKEGQQRNNQGSSGGGWFNPGGEQSNSYSYNKNWDKNSTSGIGDLIVLGVICLVVYAMYKTCIDNGGQNMGDPQYSSTGSDYPGSPGGGSGGGGWSNPGYNQNRNDYGTSGYDDASCGGARRRGTGGGGGFWTGLATGGLMGYMFGGNRGYGGGYGNRWYNRPNYGGGWGTGSGGYNRGSSFGGFSGAGGGGGGISSGTRSASGFGGTRRR